MAKQLTLAGLSLLARLIDQDPEYCSQTAKAANNAQAFALMLGDEATATAVEDVFGDLIKQDGLIDEDDFEE
jgi:hypothetical protein